MRKRLTCLVALIGVTALVSGGCSSAGPEDSPKSLPSSSPASPTESHEPGLSLVAIGDSIPYNSDGDCYPCTGFVDRYADALANATGQEVEVSNLSLHNGLDVTGLMIFLDAFEEDLRNADAIIVAIAHNSIGLNDVVTCGTRFDDATSTFEDWSKVTARCATSSAVRYRPKYDKLFATIASWRRGQPTLLRTINKYNDWIGWKEAHLTPDQEHRTVIMHDAWNNMLCRSAERHGFACADIYHAFNGPHGAKASGSLLAEDYTHPSNQGNARIARVLAAQGFDSLQ